MRKKNKNSGEAVTEPIGTEIGKRSFVLLIVVGLLFLALLLRIFILQTVHYDRYQQKVVEQLTTQSEVLAERGNIYDANGVPIATNITTYRVFISPSSIAREQAVKNQNGEHIDLPDLIAGELSGLLGVTYDFVLSETARTHYLDRTIKKGVSEADADKVRSFIDSYGLQRMIYLQATETRYYPYSNLASHAIGFVGHEGAGLYGLEYSYNKLLAGTNGRYITARDALGNEMPYEYEEYIEAEDGLHLNSTLDVYVQATLEEQIKKAYTQSGGQNRAAGIVMNVNTGAILGMAVYPDFNLNSPWDLNAELQGKLDASGYAPDSKEYSDLRSQMLLGMWANKAITESYIPGSTFKIMTAAMALEEDVVKTDEMFHCSGSKTVMQHNIHCHKTTGHGDLTFTQGIQQSCNPVLMTVGLRLGTEKFYDYFTAFGYREKTGIDLPGEGNSLYAPKKSFNDLDLAIYSFGQNFNVTLIQQITAVAAVANGGYLVTPHLMSSVVDREGKTVQSFDSHVRRQVVSSEVCKTVSGILEGGVSGNGGAKNAYVAGYRIAAKTGTSQKKNEGSLGKYICSTVAYAPADNPQYAVLIVVDEPTKGLLYGSTVAAPYVGNVMETVLPYLGVEAVYSEEELDRLTVKAPDCKGWTGSYAKKYYEQGPHPLKVVVIGDENQVVRRQFPEKGTVMEQKSGTLILYTGESGKEIEPETVTVPDITGKTAMSANQTLVNAGLNVRIKGTKNYLTGTAVKAVSQSIPAGTAVPRGTVIEVYFLSVDDSDHDVILPVREDLDG